jgi:hypothetical protein
MADIDVVPRRRTNLWLWILVLIALAVVLWFVIGPDATTAPVGWHGVPSNGEMRAGLA